MQTSMLFLLGILTACVQTPPTGSGPESPGNEYLPEPPVASFVEYLEDAGDPFSSAVLQTGITADLSANPLYTLFAPLPEWFEEAGVTEEDFLLHPRLRDIVAYNFVPSRFGPGELELNDGVTLPTLLQDADIQVTQQGDVTYLNGDVKLLVHPSAFPTTYEVDILLTDKLLLPEGVTFD